MDDTGKHNLAELRSFQDWHLRYALESVKGVAEVAPVGGFVKQYQVDLDPNKLVAYDIPLAEVVNKIRMTNGDVGGKIFEVGYDRVLRARARLHQKRRGHRERRRSSRERHAGLCEERRHRASRRRTSGAAWRNWTAKAKSSAASSSCATAKMRSASSTASRRSWRKSNLRCPKACESSRPTTAASLIKRSIATLREKLIEESIVVALVCLVFLWHVRSALVAIITLPIAIILSFLPMY